MAIKAEWNGVIFALLYLCSLSAPAIAQEAAITADGTTATDVTTPDGSNFDINGGDRAGSNLFHSFGNFGVPNGGSANFLNPVDIANIISRVTGGKTSTIEGLIVALAKFEQQNYSFLVHIENESSSKTDFNQRLFRYFCSLFLRYNRPIYPIVVFSYDSPQRLDKSDFVIDFPDKQVLHFDYSIVQLNRLNWRDFLQQKNPVAAALMAKMKIDPKDRPTVKAQCLRLLVTLKLDPAKMQLISGFVDTYLRLNSKEEAIFQSELGTMETREKEKIMQITTSWKEEGRLEGQKEGQKEGQSNTILRLLNRKLGNLPEEIATRIKSLEPEQLDTLTEDLLDFETFEDLNRWLSNF